MSHFSYVANKLLTAEIRLAIVEISLTIKEPTMSKQFNKI